MRSSGYRFLLALAVAGAGSAFAAEPPSADHKLIEQGRAIFLEKSCAHCHGHDADTGVKLAGRDDLTPDYIFSTIKDGKKSGGRLMPPWGTVLNDDEIRSVATYLMSLQKPH